MKYDVASQTDIGLVRTNNEDSFLVAPELNLFIVTDGMGGYEKGEIASQMICDSIKAFLEKVTKENEVITKADFIESVKKANLDIRDKIRQTPNLDKMGSTLVSLLIREDKLLVVNVGDSRCYRFREGQLQQISLDHSLVQETLSAGIKKELAPQFKNIVTRALGMKDHVEPDIFAEVAQNNDLFLLCTDGLHGYVGDEEIAAILNKKGDVHFKLDQLIQAAKKTGGKDNITGILLQMNEISQKESKDLTETFEIPAYKLHPKTNTFIASASFRFLIGFICVLIIALVISLFI